MTRVSLECGDCRDVMLEMAARGETFDAIVTDPPYDLTSIVQRFGADNAAPAKSNGPTGVYARASRGFMGQRWDGTGIAFNCDTWRLALEVLKPGGYLLAFGGSRTFHRMAVAIEDAGFEIRDCVMWLYGTGFPKSIDVSKAINKSGNKPRYGTIKKAVDKTDREPRQPPGSEINAALQWAGWGTALKPAFEPVIVARKPLAGTVAANVLQYGTGGLNIDASRIPLPEGDALHDGLDGDYERLNAESGWGFKRVDRAPGLGRWPANVIHDGSDQVLGAFAAFGEKTSGKPGTRQKSRNDGVCFGAESRPPGTPCTGYGDSGNVSRFFYSAKANARDRAGSRHPTVKPLALMRYLCRLVTPPGGVILDPFAGSGSTLQAAHECGFNVVGIEQDSEYQADITRRISGFTDELAEMLA